MTDPDRELDRLALRWRQLPYGRAVVSSPELRAAAQRYADAVADALGVPAQRIADLGPAAALDQLLATAYDVRRLDGRAVDAGGRAWAVRVADDAVALRRRLAPASGPGPAPGPPSA